MLWSFVSFFVIIVIVTFPSAHCLTGKRKKNVGLLKKLSLSQIVNELSPLSYSLIGWSLSWAKDTQVYTRVYTSIVFPKKKAKEQHNATVDSIRYYKMSGWYVLHINIKTEYDNQENTDQILHRIVLSWVNLMMSTVAAIEYQRADHSYKKPLSKLY